MQQQLSNKSILVMENFFVRLNNILQKFLFKLTLVFILAFLFFISSKGQEKLAFKIFDKNGKELTYNILLKNMLKKDVILFGEIHNNPIAHWLELQILKDFHKEYPQLTVGMEMLESDNQVILEEYLQGLISEKSFSSEARVWTNYETDYKPLLEYCFNKKVKVYATNIPRRYANIVYRKGLNGLDSISNESKKHIVPLPFPIDLSLPGYKTLAGEGSPHSIETNNNLAYSQAIKDATMGHFIVKNLNSKILHFNGSYHSHNYEGIIWYLRKFNSEIQVYSIETVEQSKIDTLDEQNRMAADAIIVIPDDMTKTY